MVQLELFVTNDCASCLRARMVAARAAAAFPVLNVRITDLDDPAFTPPANVFAVPTFLLDGKVASLGTPDWEQLRECIRAALAASRTDRTAPLGTVRAVPWRGLSRSRG